MIDESLNTEQKNIVLNTDFLEEDAVNATCIIACAGAGKTKTIISKVVYMIKELECDPKEFFLTTFTKNASDQIKHRLMAELDEDIVSEMTIGTFHSIAMNYCSFTNDVVDDPVESYLYKFYEIISEKDLGFKYLFIDEYQDINNIQEQIIRQLYTYAKLLIVVGDDQQNIYTFRNTNIKFILNFDKNYDNAEYQYLIKNYRCNVNFVKLANFVLSFNKNKIDKTIVAMNPNPPKKITIARFRNQSYQNECLIKKIDDMYKKGKDLSTIAIVSRNNSVLKNIESKLASLKIPSFYIDTTDANIIGKMNIQNISNRVIISTIHGTKGLEFDEQYILDINSDVFPSLMTDDIEEERRLFYVSITRAINKLTLCYDERKPSIFIEEILNNPELEPIINKTHQFQPFDGIKIVPKLKEPIKDYTVNNIVSILEHTDYKELNDFIFNKLDFTPSTRKIHSTMPSFDTFCEDRHLLIANISSVLNDFIETYISRTVQYVSNQEIENIDYLIYSLYYYKNSIDCIRSRKYESVIDDRFGTNFKHKSDEDLEKVILYYKSGLRIGGHLNDEFLQYFIKSYKRYISNKPSKDIIYDIFVISLIKGIIRGRNSILHSINFDQSKFIRNKINKQDILEFKPWFVEIDLPLKKYFNKYEYVSVSHTLYEKENTGGIKGIIDMVCDNTIYKIKPNNNINTNINTLVIALSYLSLCRRNEYEVDVCSIYNPITGIIYTWDLTEWEGHDDLLFFLTEKFY